MLSIFFFFFHPPSCVPSSADIAIDFASLLCATTHTRTLFFCISLSIFFLGVSSRLSPVKAWSPLDGEKALWLHHTIVFVFLIIASRSVPLPKADKNPISNILFELDDSPSSGREKAGRTWWMIRLTESLRRKENFFKKKYLKKRRFFYF